MAERAAIVSNGLAWWATAVAAMHFKHHCIRKDEHKELLHVCLESVGRCDCGLCCVCVQALPTLGLRTEEGYSLISSFCTYSTQHSTAQRSTAQHSTRACQTTTWHASPTARCAWAHGLAGQVAQTPATAQRAKQVPGCSRRKPLRRPSKPEVHVSCHTSRESNAKSLLLMNPLPSSSSGRQKSQSHTSSVSSTPPS
jgi:hypothetical protein